MNEADADLQDPEDRQPEGNGLGDITRKVFSLGLGAYFLTEEKVVGMIREARLPREIGSSITANASRAKDELISFMAREATNLLKQIDIQDELRRALVNHKIKISAELEFLPRPAGEAPGTGGTEPEIRRVDVSGDGTAGTSKDGNPRFQVKAILDPKLPKAEETKLSGASEKPPAEGKT